MNRQIRRLQEREERLQKKTGVAPKTAAAKPAAVPRRVRAPRASVPQFLREVKGELAKVGWPARQTLITYTMVSLIAISVLTAVAATLDGGFQYLFYKVLLK